MKKNFLCTLAVGACLLITGLAQAQILIDEDFANSSISNDQVRLTLAHAGDGSGDDWKSRSDSLWNISGGNLNNPGTTLGRPAEGGMGQLYTVTTTDTSLTNLRFAFDYNVGAGSTLYFHATGLTQNGTPAAGEHLNNLGAQNGNVQNQSETHFADINIFTGTDSTGAAGTAMSFASGTSGTYDASFDLSGYSWSGDESPGVTGSLGNVTSLEYLSLMFASDVTDASGAGAISIDNFQVEATVAPFVPPTRFQRVDMDGSNNSLINGSFEDLTVESGTAGANAWIAGSNSNCSCQTSVYTVHQWSPFFSDPEDVVGRYGANGTVEPDSWYTGITSNINPGEGTFDGDRGIKIDSADFYQNGLANEDFLSALDPKFINPDALYKLTVELTRRNGNLAGDATGTATVSVTDSAVDPTNSDFAIPGGQITGIISDLPLGTTQFELELSGADLANASQLNLLIEATNFQELGADEAPLGRDTDYTASIMVDNFQLFGYLPGDSDGDFDVDNDDLAAWQANVGLGIFRADNTTSFALGDFDIDGEVDADDFAVWQANFTGPLPPSAVVPEPSSIALLFGCVFLLFGRGIRRPNRASIRKAFLGTCFLLLFVGYSNRPTYAQATDPLDSSKVLNLTSFATFSSISQSGAIDLQHSYDGTGRVFVSTNEGKIHAFSSTGSALPTFLDLDAPGVLPDFSDSLSFTTRGLSYFTFHPDYGNAGAAGEGKLYTVYKTTEPSATDHTYTGVGLPTIPGSTISEFSITEWSVDATNANQVDTSSRREVMRFEISGNGENSHSIGQLAFNPFARPGESDYGNLYIPIGDMNNTADLPIFQHVQDADNPFGKILRINPLEDGAEPYSVPVTNPLNDGGNLLDTDDNTEEIFAWGFRNPQNMSFAKDAAGNARIVSFDIGAADFEEVNLVDLGDNHGWSRYDGPNSGNTWVELNEPAGSTLEFPATVYDHAFPVVPGATPVAGNAAITGGFVVSDPDDPNFKNQLVFGDLSTGAFFHSDFDELVTADATDTQAALSVMNVSIDGSAPGAFRDLVDQPRGDVRFGVDESGRLFVFSKREDIIYVTDLIANQNPDAGDYNGNGIVDAADYTVWRDNLGQPAGSLINDVDGGVIDVDQYNTWKTNFELRATTASNSLLVPEPSSLAMYSFALLALLYRRRTR